MVIVAQVCMCTSFGGVLDTITLAIGLPSRNMISHVPYNQWPKRAIHIQHSKKAELCRVFIMLPKAMHRISILWVYRCYQP